MKSRHCKRIIALIIAMLMLVGMLITGFLAFGMQGIADTAIEIIYIFFWFFADLTACYSCLDGFENRKKRLLAGRQTAYRH